MSRSDQIRSDIDDIGSDWIRSDIWMVHVRSNLIRSDMDNIGSVITTDAMPSPLATEGAGDVDGRSRERHRDIRDGCPVLLEGQLGQPFLEGDVLLEGHLLLERAVRRCPSRRTSPSRDILL